MCRDVLECNHWVDPFQAACLKEGAWPNRQDSLLRPHFPKTETGRVGVVLYEKLGGASKISLLPRPDQRAPVREAGSDGRDYTLRAAGNR